MWTSFRSVTRWEQPVVKAGGMVKAEKNELIESKTKFKYMLLLKINSR